MSALFGDPNSFLGGGDLDDELPLVVGAIDTLFFGSDTPEILLFCTTCEKRYALPEIVDDARLLEMCPRCAHLSGGTVESQEPAASPDR
jgi:hypothetical protein